MVVSSDQSLEFPLYRLRKTNSADFVRKAFSCYESGVPFVIDSPGGRSDSLFSGKLVDVEIADGGGWISPRLSAKRSANPAQIIFSSGTEGEPKAIVISYSALANVVDRINRKMEVTSEIKEYISVPVYYSFGLGRCRAIGEICGSAYIPSKGFSVDEVFGMLASGEINSISAVPSQWRLVIASAAKFDSCGKRLRWAEVGSQYMSAQEKQQLKEIFPNAKIVQHYGLTEASRTALLDISEATISELASVGKVSDGVRVRVGADGRIAIRGDHLASGVFRDGKIEPLNDGDGWFYTSDKGEVVGDTLFFHGRIDEIINCGGVKINPDTIQQHLVQELGPVVAVFGLDDPLRGQVVMVATTMEDCVTKIGKMAFEQCSLAGLTSREAIKVCVVDNIPYTDTGKVKRKQLAELCQQREPDSSDRRDVLAVFQALFGRQVDSSLSFKQLGGDSLSYVQVSAKLDHILGELPINWESQPIKELAARAKAAPSETWRKVEMPALLRAVAILAVVAVHAGVWSIAGATFLLFMLVGYTFARFNTDHLLGDGRWHVIGKFSVYLLVPYYIFAFLLFFNERQLDLPLLLLYENYLSLDLTLIFPFWFVQQLVQCIVILGLVFSLFSSNAWFRTNLPSVSVVFLSAIVFLGVLIELFFAETPWLEGSPFAFFLPIYMLGWAMYQCRERYMLIGYIVLLGGVFAFLHHGVNSRAFWLLLGCVLIPLAVSIPMPPLLRGVIVSLSASTYAIFITNGIVIYIVQHVLGVSSVLVSIVAAVVAGVSTWYLFGTIVAWFRR